MTIEAMTTIVACAVLLLIIIAVAIVWANGVAAEPPATETEKRQWPGE